MHEQLQVDLSHMRSEPEFIQILNQILEDEVGQGLVHEKQNQWVLDIQDLFVSVSRSQDFGERATVILLTPRVGVSNLTGDIKLWKSSLFVNRFRSLVKERSLATG